jgi:hypothetical protein
MGATGLFIGGQYLASVIERRPDFRYAVDPPQKTGKRP